MAVRQPHCPSPRERTLRRQRYRPHRRLHGGGRRPIDAEPVVVLHIGALLLGQQLHRQHVLRRWQSRHRRPVHQERDGAPDVADHAAQQAIRVLRRDRQVSRTRHAEQRRPRNRLIAGSLPPTTRDRSNGRRPRAIGCCSRRGTHATSSNTRTATRRVSRNRDSPRNGSPARRGSRTTWAGVQQRHPSRPRRARSVTMRRRRCRT
jgi:hypothetical protein